MAENTRCSKTQQQRVQEIFELTGVDEFAPYIKNPLKNLIEKYEDVFSLPDEKLTTNNFYTQNIELTDHKAVYIPNYKIIHAQKDEINRQVNKMLKDDIIEPSISPFNSPILLVPKKSNNNEKTMGIGS